MKIARIPLEIDTNFMNMLFMEGFKKHVFNSERQTSLMYCIISIACYTYSLLMPEF